MRKIIAALQILVDGFIEGRMARGGTIKPAGTRETTTPSRFENFADERARAYEAM